MIPLERLDRRKVRTRQLLRDALLALVAERGYEAITVQDITERAEVNRSTFYLHYKDKDELLFESMREMYDEIVRTAYRDKGIIGNGLPDDIPHSEDLRHVARFADFYRVMLSEHGSARFIIRVLDYLQQVAQQEMTYSVQSEQTEPIIAPGFVAAFCAGAQIGVIRWWLANGMKETPEKMALMLTATLFNGIDWALHLQREDIKQTLIGML